MNGDQNPKVYDRKEVLLGFVFGGIFALTIYVFFFGFDAFLYFTKKNFYWPVLDTFKKTLLSPLFLILVPLYFLAQYLYPADKKQKIFSANLVQDFVYVFIGAVFGVLVTAVWVGLLRSLYDQHLQFLTVKAIGQWPEWVRLIWGILLADFVFWFHHWVRHKVPWFWEFHAIHHSQKEMNIFTDDRYHFIEYVIENFFNVLILTMLAVGVSEIVYFTIFRKWYTRFYHGSVKTNFGILKYILVTPQSHRVHHSIEPRHRDMNFGVLFSIWDHMLGTQYRGYEEYPETGITDEEFPFDSPQAGLDLILVPIMQFLHPFRKIGKSLKNIIKRE